MLGLTIPVESNLAKKRGINYAVLYAIIADVIKANKENDGFAPLSAESLNDLTGLSRRQQDLVFKKMVEDGVLLIEKRGVPCRRYFKMIDGGI